MTRGPMVGHSMKLYYSLADPDSVAWVLIGDVGDVSIGDLSVGAAELKRRGNNWTKNLPTLFQSFSISTTLLHNLNTTVFTALRTAFLAKTIFELAVLNGAVEDGDNHGLRVPVVLNEFPWNQELESVSSHDVSFTVAFMKTAAGAEVNPSWMITETGP